MKIDIIIAYIARYFVGLGETQALLAGRGAAAPQWFGAPRWLWRRLIGEWLRYRLHRLISPAPVWLAQLRDYSLTRGAIRYWRLAASGEAGGEC